MSAPQSPPLNTVTWWEIPVTDLDIAQTFYAAVFGWTFVPFGEGFLGVMNGPDLVGGLFASPETAATVGIRVYVNVADIEDTLARAEAAGGTIRSARVEVGGDMGWWAEIVDPGGRGVGVCSSSPAAA